MLYVDFSLFVYRMFHAANNAQLSTKAGVPTGLEFFTLKNLASLEKQYGKVVLCLDKNGKAERKKVEEKYKANRASEPEGEDAKNGPGMWARVKAMMPALHYKYAVAAQADYEADDILYSLTRDKRDSKAYIYTNDKDLLQCVSPHCSVLTSFKSAITEYTPERMWEKYLIHPYQWLYYRTFTGDSSDNLPGVPRFRKAVVSQACRCCVKECYVTDELILDRVSEHLMNRASAKEIEALEKFLESGQHIRNFQVMRLRFADDIKIIAPNASNKSAYDNFIDRLELASLKEETEF